MTSVMPVVTGTANTHVDVDAQFKTATSTANTSVDVDAQKESATVVRSSWTPSTRMQEAVASLTLTYPDFSSWPPAQKRSAIFNSINPDAAAQMSAQREEILTQWSSRADGTGRISSEYDDPCIPEMCESMRG